MPIKNSRKRRDLRRAIAVENNEKRASLTDEQQLAKLDSMFGKGKGAKKERARLEKRIAAAKK